VAKGLLAEAGIEIFSHVINIGGVAIQPEPGLAAGELRSRAAASELGCIDPAAEAKMKEVIQAAKERGDTLGGIFEVVACGVMPGLGSHVQWDRRLDTMLSGALMSIPAIKGVEIGEGFTCAVLPGSKAHDEIFHDAVRGFFHGSNRAGGIEGGMSNGELIIARAAMKPIPTLMTPLASADILTREATRANTERSDVCAVTAAGVVGEAMTAIVLAGALVEKFGGDSIGDLKAAIGHYRRRISG
jgi:chorismate synthase